MGKHHRLGPYIIILLLIIILFIVYQRLFIGNVTPEMIKAYILSLGSLAPIALITILTLLGVISILPNTPFVIASGYVFGTWLGAFYGFIGIMLGSSIVFGLSKTLGRPFVERIVDNEELKHFDIFFEKKGIYSLFIIRLIPMFPADIASFAAGLTEIRYRHYALITAATIIPPLLIQNFFGSILARIEEINILLLIISIILAVLLVLMYILRHKIKRIFIKDLRFIEKDVKRAGKRAAKEIKTMEREVSLRRIK